MPPFLTVQAALNSLVTTFRHATEQRKDKDFHSPHLQVDRTRYFLRLLGAPEKKQKIIHVAGTSGKGSTVSILAQLLAAHGFKVGSVTSPHLVRYNERFLINGTEINDEQLLKYLNHSIAVAESMSSTSFGKPNFKSINTAIAYQYFHEQRTDYSVVETEMGGLYDETNTELDADKISVIADLGYDHTKALGDSLTSIAFHKAGIMTENSTCFALWGKDESNTTITDMAFARNVSLIWTKPSENFRIISVAQGKTVFSYISSSFTLSDLKLSLLGEHQVRNTSLALRTLEYIASRDHWQLDEQKIRAALKNLSQSIHGRIEHRKISNHDCYLDVAHNEQKVTALIDTLTALHPQQKFTFIIGFKETKEFQEIIDILAPSAARFIVTNFVKETIGVPFEPAVIKTIESYLHSTYPKIERATIPNASAAFEEALKTKEPVVITGSFYHLSEIFQTSPHFT